MTILIFGKVQLEGMKDDPFSTFSMELWFERALKLDPNDSDACSEKLSWLKPKWHGDPGGAELLAFGKQCAATKNWTTGITLLGADALFIYGVQIHRGGSGDYLRRPDNWSVIQSVYEEFFKHHPRDYVNLTKYACLAATAGRVGIAHLTFQKLGDHETPWSGDPGSTPELIKQIRERNEHQIGELLKAQNPQPAKSPR